MSNPEGALAFKGLTSNDASPQNDIGATITVLTSAGGVKEYKYVEVAADTTVANGTALLYVLADTARLSVTSDLTDANTNDPAGVGIGAITAEQYGWIQTKGYHAAVATNGDDDIAANDAIIMGAADGVVDSVAAGTAPTNKVFGFAQAADVDAADTVATILDL